MKGATGESLITYRQARVEGERSDGLAWSAVAECLRRLARRMPAPGQESGRLVLQELFEALRRLKCFGAPGTSAARRAPANATLSGRTVITTKRRTPTRTCVTPPRIAHGSAASSG